jgi:Zn-dependent M28 family amino/carboxypeptidase
MYGDLATDAPARNVVAILRGSDPKLRAEFVAIGAHNDHNGLMAQAVDHDSLEAYDRVLRPQGAESEDRPATADELVRVAAIRDSLTKAHGGARRDSVMNGADDDGSGSVTVLEIAEALAKGAERPKRSILFVWHTAEEKGLFGSQYFTDHPTVPRDSIVAQLNMDMVGRGSAADLPNGSPNYLQLLGSRRLSTELGDLVEKVNTTKGYGFAFDYSFDADGHPQQYYCRSDHYMYARYGIPITFFSTGAHHDYHQATDEPQYIDYEHMARVGNYVKDLALTVANLDHRPVVDKPKPDPKKDCRQ